MWERAVNPTPCNGNPTCSQAEAVSYCEANRTGGFADWRLPIVIELVSLLDFTVAEPAALIDAIAFPNTPADRYWTSMQLAGRSGSPAGWYVRFDLGDTWYDASGAIVLSRVRCVRAARTSCYSPPRFSVQGADATATVMDAATKLVWQQKPSTSTLTWEQAMAYCGAPFRLPSVKELQTIIDYTKPIPSGEYSTIVPDAFPNTPIDYFWSSSTCDSPSSGAFLVSTVDGRQGRARTGYQLFARCVR